MTIPNDVTVRQIQLWLDEIEADNRGPGEVVPRWQASPENIAAAMQSVGITNTEMVLSSMDAAMETLDVLLGQTLQDARLTWEYRRDDYDLLLSATTPIGSDNPRKWWVKVVPWSNPSAYIWSGCSTNLNIAMGLTILCIACNPKPMEMFDDRILFADWN